MNDSSRRSLFGNPRGRDESPPPVRKPSRKKSKPQALHVLLLANRFEVRGSSARTLMIAENLPDYGFRPTIVTPNMKLVAPERRAKLQVREYAYLTTPLLSRLMVRFIADDLADDPPDLIDIQSRKMLPYGLALSRRLGCPYVVTIHDYPPPDEILTLDRTLRKNVIAVSEAIKQSLLKQPHLSSDMIQVIHSGVDLMPDLAEDAIFQPQRTPVVGFAGPLEAVKGVAYFLRAARQVLDEFPQVEFLVAGSGPEERNLRQLVRSLGISPHVTFVSNLYGFREPLQAMDLFCLPSLQQGLGTIMLEALAWGRPVIASNVGGISAAITDGETGLLVPPGDPNALAARILELLRDPQRARQIGAAGQEHVRKNFRVDQAIRLITDLYREVIAEASE